MGNSSLRALRSSGTWARGLLHEGKDRETLRGKLSPPQGLPERLRGAGKAGEG